MILLNTIYFIPAFATLLWIVLLCFKRKILTQWLMLLLILFCIYYYISYALYISPWTDYQLMVRFDVLNLPISMCILAVNILFVISHSSRKFYDSKWHWLIYVPAIIYLAMAVLLYDLVGLDRVAYCAELNDKGLPIPAEYLTPAFQLHCFITDSLFNALAFVFILVTVYVCARVARVQGYRFGDIYRFFFKGAETTTVRAVCVMDAITISTMIPIALLGRMWMLHHPVVGAIISLLTAISIFLLCYIEYFVEMRRCTLYKLFHLELSPAMTKHHSIHETPSIAPIEESVEVSEVNPVEEVPEGLPKLVYNAFEVDQVYRDIELSIVSLSDHLGTNRTTLSATVNQVFGLSFRQVVNSYRVEAAKKYMLEHPNATQDAIAIECGFSSAQAFNLKFKAATGRAPRAWLMTNLPE